MLNGQFHQSNIIHTHHSDINSTQQLTNNMIFTNHDQNESSNNLISSENEYTSDSTHDDTQLSVEFSQPIIPEYSLSYYVELCNNHVKSVNHSLYINILQSLTINSDIKLLSYDHQLTSDEYLSVIITIADLAKNVSVNIKNEFDDAFTTMNKLNLIDKYFGIEYLTNDLMKFILNMQRIHQYILHQHDFTLTFENNHIYIDNHSSSTLVFNKSFKQINWQTCLNMKDRHNRSIIRVVTNSLNDELNQLIYEVLNNHFNLFAIFE